MDCVLHDLDKQQKRGQETSLAYEDSSCSLPQQKLFVKCLELISTLAFASLDLWFQQDSFDGSIHVFTEVPGTTEPYAGGVGRPETPFFSSLPT